MSLKTRLIVSFSMMIGLTVILGGILIGSSWFLRSEYTAYERNRQLYDLIVNLTQTFEKQQRALNSYLITGTETDRNRYDSFELEINQLLRQWKELADFAVEKNEQEKTENRVKSLKSGLDQVFRLAETGYRREAIQIMDSALLLTIDGIQKEFKSLAAQKKEQYDRSWKSTKRLAKRTTLFSLMLLISVVVVGTGFSIAIYHSVTRPLAKLQDAARKIGAGELNLKLDLSEPAEMAELARTIEEMAESLSELQTQIVQMDRMSAIGTLAGGVAHEINNPLTGVLGQSQLLLEKMDPDDPNRVNVQKIEGAAQRCRKIVRGLLDFSRPTEYHFQPTDINEIIQATLSLCDSEMVASRIFLVWNIKKDLPKAWASANHLQQVLLNIVTNAMHAMHRGGTLTILTEHEAGENNILLNPADQQSGSSMIRISVTDTGTGIDQEHLSHIFEPFFTTKEPGKGTGLGLSISYGIIHQHKGKIEAYSEGIGRGAVFVVRIPVAERKQEPKSDDEIKRPVPRFGAV